MIAGNLPALQVVVPLLGAPVCALIGRRNVGWLLTVAISWTLLVVSAVLLQRVLSDGPISYAVGGWAPPWGIELRVDLISAFGVVCEACSDGEDYCLTIHVDQIDAMSTGAELVAQDECNPDECSEGCDEE